MICEDARAKLTAYLDGELEGDRGSAIRGHLRGCEMCRNLATDEAALRDGLRALPPLDPPHSLWTNIQHRLAAEEVADSDRPAWRRALARFAARWRPLAPQFALGSAALAAAVFVLALRYRASEPAGTTFAMPALPPIQQQVATAPTTIDGDVTAELAADTARKTASYRQAAEELVSFAVAKRDSWTDDRKAVFDGKLASFRKDAAAAPTERARDKIYRQMRTYLQDVAIRDVVTANDRKLAGTRGAP